MDMVRQSSPVLERKFALVVRKLFSNQHNPLPSLFFFESLP